MFVALKCIITWALLAKVINGQYRWSGITRPESWSPIGAGWCGAEWALKQRCVPPLLWNSKWCRSVLVKDTLTETENLNLHIHSFAINMYCQSLTLSNILQLQIFVLICAIFLHCLYCSVHCCSVVYVHNLCCVDFVIKTLAPAKSTRVSQPTFQTVTSFPYNLLR